MAWPTRFVDTVVFIKPQNLIEEVLMRGHNLIHVIWLYKMDGQSMLSGKNKRQKKLS